MLLGTMAILSNSVNKSRKDLETENCGFNWHLDSLDFLLKHRDRYLDEALHG